MDLKKKHAAKLERLYRDWDEARSKREMRCPVFTSGKGKSRAADILSLVPVKEIMEATQAYEEALKAERKAWRAYRKQVIRVVGSPRGKA